VHARTDGKKGTTFWFEIPYRPDEISAKSEVPIFASSDAISKLLQTLQVLNAPAAIVPINGSIDARDDMAEDAASDLTDDFDDPENIYRSIPSAPRTPTAAATSTKKPVVDVANATSPPLSSSIPSPEDAAVSPLIPTSHPSNKLTIPTNSILYPVPINTPHYNILVADDSPTIAKMIQMLLKQNKHRVTLAENGETARKKILQQWEEHGRGYDLVLMDLQMPVMDGLEATRRCREVETGIYQAGETDSAREGAKSPTAHAAYGKHQLIIGMSANCDDETIEVVNEAGFDDFITKPFSIETFNTVAKKWIS
jgi:CheY-like chemotaxis protein